MRPVSTSASSTAECIIPGCAQYLDTSSPTIGIRLVSFTTTSFGRRWATPKSKNCGVGAGSPDARRPYPDFTIAQRYDPGNDRLNSDLTKAHRELDSAVERAYGLEPVCDEKEIVELLFQLYSDAITSNK